MGADLDRIFTPAKVATVPGRAKVLEVLQGIRRTGATLGAEWGERILVVAAAPQPKRDYAAMGQWERVVRTALFAAELVDDAGARRIGEALAARFGPPEERSSGTESFRFFTTWHLAHVGQVDVSQVGRVFDWFDAMTQVVVNERHTYCVKRLIAFRRSPQLIKEVRLRWKGGRSNHHRWAYEQGLEQPLDRFPLMTRESRLAVAAGAADAAFPIN